MKKEVYRGVYKEFRKGKTEKVADFENRLNTRVLTDLVKDATVIDQQLTIDYFKT